MRGASPESAGRAGGRAVVGQTAEPKTLNPLLAADQPSRDAIYALSADLVHINRSTQRTEPALAKSWNVSADGRHYTLVLRDGLRFSDGAPLTADDVVFTFQIYLDPAVNSPQRDLLMMDGKPIAVSKISANTIRVDLPAAYGPGERLFDSFWILPKHRLEKVYQEGHLAQTWGVGSSPSDLAGAGPFRVKQFQPGQRLIFERNPYYWKKDEAGQPLPYLDELELSFAADQNAQLLRLIASEVDAAAHLRPEDFARLEKQPRLQARDAGSSLEYNFFFFNWNASGPEQSWFRNLKFRQAVSCAIDREGIVKLVYQGRAEPIWDQVTAGNRLWRNDSVARCNHDVPRAEQLLREAGFRRNPEGQWADSEAHPIQFSVLVSASSQVRRKMATIIQEDLSRIGIQAQVTPVEFGTMLDAVLNTRKFDAAVWGVASGDADPNVEMNVWTTAGSMHVWNLKSGGGADPRVPSEPWELEIDKLMRAQMDTPRASERKAAYDRVQQLIAENLPVVFLVSPHALSAARESLGNYDPSIIEPVLLWNCERWYWKK